ncbi:MAG: hypothetical protein D6732_00160 [Methanobacteriota archaeon]|nr:MAG: hypothetical protein D6732_00160 [Euryarchaeota archaeon]
MAFHNAAGKRLGVAKLRSNIPITNAEQMIEDAWQRVKARMEQQTEAPKPTTGRSKADNTEQDEDAPF